MCIYIYYNVYIYIYLVLLSYRIFMDGLDEEPLGPFPTQAHLQDLAQWSRPQAQLNGGIPLDHLS